MIFNPIKETSTDLNKKLTFLALGLCDMVPQFREIEIIQSICNEIGFLWKTDESLTAND